MKTMIQNQGFTKTVLYDNHKEKMSEIKWDANYDGKNAHVLLNINKDGKKQKIDMNLDNSDLAKMLNITTVNKPLDQRLLDDFDFLERERNYPVSPMQLPMIELPGPPTPYSHYTHISSPQNFEEFIKPLQMQSPRKHRKTQTLIKVRKSSRNSKSKSKSKSKSSKSNSRSSYRRTKTSRKHTM